MSITGAIKVIDVPEDASLTTVRDLLQQLERYLAVEFDVDKITNVVVSSLEPEVSERDIVWFRLDNAGNFIGVFVFVQGQWLQMFPCPNEVTKVTGDSRNPPPGYALVSTELAGFTTAMVNKLQTEWELDPSETYYVIFHVVYVGL